MTLLLLEDDAILADILVDYLEERYEVVHCFNLPEARKQIEARRFGLYLFDINVPGGRGIDLLRDLRSLGDTTPAVVITAYEDTAHLLQSFEHGANDFIRKPFELEELGARIKNISKLHGFETERYPLGAGISFDAAARQLHTPQGVRALSAKESQLLEYLIRNRGRVVTATELLHNLWEYEEMPAETAIRTHIKTLRALIGRERITNIRGEGYRFD